MNTIMRILAAIVTVLCCFTSSWSQVWNYQTQFGTEKSAVSGIGMPWDVAIGSDGLIYIADNQKLNIKVFDVNYALVRLVDVSSRFTSMSGIDVSPDGRIYVSDRETSKVAEYDQNGNFVKYIGEGQLFSPRAVAVYEDQLVICDAWNSRVAVYSRITGQLMRSFGSYGSSPGQFWDPQSVDVLPNGDIVMLDTYNNRIQIFDQLGNLKTIISNDSLPSHDFAYPHGLSVDRSGYIYVTDKQQCRFHRFDSSGKWISTTPMVAGTDYFGIDLDADGNVYACNIVTGNVEVYKKHLPTYKITGYLNVKNAANESFSLPTGLAIRNDSHIFVTDYFDGTIYEFDEALSPLGNVFPKGSLTYPYGLAVDNESLVVANAVALGNSRGNIGVYKFGLSNLTFFGDMHLPTGVCRSQSGYTFVLETYGNQVSVYDSNNAFVRTIGSGSLGGIPLSHPEGIAVGNDDLLYISDSANYRVVVLTRNGDFVRSWATPNYPSGILMDLCGNVIVTERISNQITVYSVDGRPITTFGKGSFSSTYQANIDSKGNLYVIDAEGKRIVKWTPSYPPNTILNAGPASSLSSWTSANVIVTLSSTSFDANNLVSKIHYSINMGAEQIVSGSSASFTLTETGSHSISYFAVDNAGNTETAKLATVRIDKIAPVTTLTRNAGLITLSATDAHSGVAKIMYQVNGGAVTDYSVPFADTIHKVTYWAEDAAGNIEAAKTDIINAGVQSITVTQPQVTGGVGVIGTVTLDKAAGVGGTVINLSSSLPSVAVVDATVTVPEGGTSASFDIDANPVSVATSVSITASIYETSQSALVNVLAPMPSSVTWSVSPVPGGTSTTGTLSISGPAPTGGTTVSVASSSLSAIVGSSVTIPAGAMTTTFTVSTNVVINDTSAVISATVYGAKLKSTLSILGPKVTSVTLASASIASTNTTTGTVTLSTNAPVGGKVVSLSSSNAAVASVPISVTVAAGTRTATFTITAGTVTANTNATIIATTNNSSGTATITVTPPAAVLSTLTTNVAAVTGGVPVTGTVVLTSPAPTGGAIVTLSSSSTTIGTVPASVTVAAGATSATFTITTRTVTAASSLTITATRNGVSKTATITVNPVRVVSSLTLNPTSVKGGTNSTGTVTLSGIATEAVVVTLTSGTTAVARVPASVTVPAGSTTATFTITTLTQTATRTSIITARTGTTSRTATLSVTR